MAQYFDIQNTFLPLLQAISRFWAQPSITTNAMLKCYTNSISSSKKAGGNCAVQYGNEFLLMLNTFHNRVQIEAQQN